MDEVRTDAVIRAIARDAPKSFVLWRSAGLGGSDVDVVAAPGSEAALASALRTAGLTPAPRPGGRVMWTQGDAVKVDVLAPSAWPAAYPPLGGLLARSAPGSHGALVASTPDRLLVLAADAVAGRPLAKLADRAEQALAEHAAAEDLRALATELGSRGLGRLASDPAALRKRARRGRLPWTTAARVAASDPAARSAFTARARAATASKRRARRGLLIAFNGMDGAGKSTAARIACARLEAAGLPATVAWARLGQEARLQDALARPVKRVLGARGTVADPLAATIGADREAFEGRQAERRTGPVAWTWTLVVAAINARAHRRATRGLRSGQNVVCDRWLSDSLVDLQIRYGGHAAAERLLRLAVPRPDLGILLAIDVATSLERKPGDQAEAVLVRMERLYRESGRRSGLVEIDARRPLEVVSADVAALVDALLGERRT